MEQDIEVLDGSGRVVRVIPAAARSEQVAAQKAQEDAAKAAAQRDRTLLATYLSSPTSSGCATSGSSCSSSRRT